MTLLERWTKVRAQLSPNQSMSLVDLTHDTIAALEAAQAMAKILEDQQMNRALNGQIPDAHDEATYAALQRYQEAIK